MNSQIECTKCIFLVERNQVEQGLGVCRRMPELRSLRDLIEPNTVKGNFTEIEHWCGEFIHKGNHKTFKELI